MDEKTPVYTVHRPDGTIKEIYEDGTKVTTIGGSSYTSYEANPKDDNEPEK